MIRFSSRRLTLASLITVTALTGCSAEPNQQTTPPTTTSAATSAATTGAAIAWSATGLHAMSAPVVVDDRVLLISADTSGALALVALNRADGR